MIPQPVTDPVDAHDAWALTNSGYDVEKFYVRASDSNGHADVVHVKLAPNLASMVARCVDQEGLPYASKADVVRDALIHRLRWIEQQRAHGVELKGLTDEAIYLADLELARHTRELRAQVRRDTWEWVQKLMHDGFKSEAVEWVDRFEAMADEYDERHARLDAFEAIDQMRAYIDNPVRSTLSRRHVS